MAEPTAEQQEALVNMKQLIRSTEGGGGAGAKKAIGICEKDDACLYRFLRARNYHVQNATTMFTKFCDWRENLGELKEEEFKDKPWCQNGTVTILAKHDKLKRPVIVFTPRYHNPYVRDINNLTRFLVWTVEQCISKMEPGGEQFVLLVDFVGCAYRNVNDMPLGREVINVFQNMFPERLGTSIVCNGPWFFSAVWKLLSYVMDEKTVAKTQFFGKDFKQRILQFIDADALPENFGGTLLNVKPKMDCFDKKVIKAFKESKKKNGASAGAEEEEEEPPQEEEIPEEALTVDA